MVTRAQFAHAVQFLDCAPRGPNTKRDVDAVFVELGAADGVVSLKTLEAAQTAADSGFFVPRASGRPGAESFPFSSTNYDRTL